MTAGTQVLASGVGILPDSTWIAVLQIDLPEAGRYRFGGAIRCATNVSSGPPSNPPRVLARLFDVTNNVVVPQSQIQLGGATVLSTRDEHTTPICAPEYSVTGPVTIQLEVQRPAGPGYSNCEIRTGDSNGHTMLNYLKTS